MKLEHIYKSYGEKKVLQDYSIEIPEGKCTVLMGESGCGKTTLLRIMMGIESAQLSGDALPEKISAVFQENRLCMDFSAVENVAMVMPGRAKKKDEIKTILDTFSQMKMQGDCLYQPVKELSGGMQRRVAIARALLADATLVIMDEPFEGLDADTKLVVMDYVKAACKGKTLLLVTHDEAEAKYLGDLLYHM